MDVLTSVPVAVPRPVMRLSQPGVYKRRDSESQLQSLVARVQCGDWPPVLTSLLRDRVQEAGSEEAAQEELTPRSIYRETLFLNMTVPKSSLLEIGMSDIFSTRLYVCILSV